MAHWPPCWTAPLHKNNFKMLDYVGIGDPLAFLEPTDALEIVLTFVFSIVYLEAFLFFF